VFDIDIGSKAGIAGNREVSNEMADDVACRIIEAGVARVTP
jgi:hypothetical protein